MPIQIRVKRREDCREGATFILFASDIGYRNAMSWERPSRNAGKRTYVDESDVGSDKPDSGSEEEEVQTSRRTKRQRPAQKNCVTPTNEGINDEDYESDDPVSGKKNTPYEAGQILRVEVENFMCHRKFTLDLGRNLNFITGRNGSGMESIKSCILCSVYHPFPQLFREVGDRRSNSAMFGLQRSAHWSRKQHWQVHSRRVRGSSCVDGAPAQPGSRCIQARPVRQQNYREARDLQKLRLHLPPPGPTWQSEHVFPQAKLGW